MDENSFSHSVPPEKIEWIEGVDFLLRHDVEALLPLPLEEVRRRLNFITPTVYLGVPAEVRSALLKPKLKKTQAERERAPAV